MTYKKKDKRNRSKIKVSRRTTLFIQPWCSEDEN